MAKVIQNTRREGAGCSDILNEILSKVSRFILSLQLFGLRLRNFSHRDQIQLKLKAKHDRVKNAINSDESSL